MNYDDNQPETSELDELLSAFCDARLTKPQQIQLDALVRSDPAARREYLRYMHLHASLSRLLRMPPGVGSPDDAKWMHHFMQPAATDLRIDLGRDDGMPAVNELTLDDALIASAIQPTEPTKADDRSETIEDDYILPPLQSIHAPQNIAMQPPSDRRRSFGSAAIRWKVAACVALAVGIGWFALRRSGNRAVNQPFAQVAASVDARWGAGAPDGAGALAANTPLALTAGYVELAFANGAKVVAEAPAEFTVDSPAAMSLSSGKLTATVIGGGFVVNTPSAKLTDLGTAFGVEVDPQKRTYLDVFQGRVQAMAVDPHQATGHPQIVKASEAVDIAANGMGIQAAEARPLAFVRSAQFSALRQASAEGHPAFVRWQAFSRQLAADPSLVAYYTFQRDPGAPEILRNYADSTRGQADGAIENAAWGTGRFGGKDALIFNGNNSRVNVDIPQSMPRITVALWVEMQAPSHALNGFLMSDGLGRRCEMQCQIGGRGGLNFDVRDLSDSPSGWASITAHDDPAAIEPGHWRFFVIEYDSSAMGQGRWYVDGKFVYQHPRGRELLPVVIGNAQIGNYAAPPGSDRPQRALNGRIDELAVFSRILDAREIAAMYGVGAEAHGHAP